MPRPMFGAIIRDLLDHKLTTIREIEEVTGRAPSTIYRWMSGESEPHHTDMRLLVGRLGNPNARRTILSMLTADLPVVISWIDEVESASPRGPGEGDRADGHEVLERSLLALDCLTHAMAEGNDAIRRQELSREAYIRLVKLVDEAIRHLTASRQMLQRYAPPDRVAAPAAPPAPGSG